MIGEKKEVPKMKNLTLKIGGAAIAVVIAALVFTGCGGDATLSSTSTCADWNGVSSDTQNSYVASSAKTDNVTASSFANDVTQQCAGHDSLNLTGVISSVSLMASLGGN